MQVGNSQKWAFFCHIKCMTEKRLAYKMCKRVLFILTGKQINKLPENHIVRRMLEDLQYSADSLLRCSNPEAAIKLYQKVINSSCENVKEKINELII